MFVCAWFCSASKPTIWGWLKLVWFVDLLHILHTDTVCNQRMHAWFSIEFVCWLGWCVFQNILDLFFSSAVYIICFTFKFSIQQKNDQQHLHPLWQYCVCSIELSAHSIALSFSMRRIPNYFTYLAFVYNTYGPKWATRFDAHFWEHEITCAEKRAEQTSWLMHFSCISFRSIHILYTHSRTFNAQNRHWILRSIFFCVFHSCFSDPSIEDRKLNR